ncbi:exonuclease domain-containing protein [uncultured Dietzia sp.]|uniref:exonuclease domain-containing protein n=1 Tax=uncultured Dietzia sp. TaxID=395519 RepID=UPI0025F3D621|nr:exonuclease domain-containing protein [uncultured Dietzia sp.]
MAAFNRASATPKFAVVDVETTGLSYNAHHRIIEIGVVLLDSSLRPEQHWETLVNPNRDLGPTRVHGIRARDLRDAPEFSDIAHELADLLDGRILVAHNAMFDSGFVSAEYRRLGVQMGDLAASSVCTMQLAPRVLRGVGRGLEACCAAAGIINERAHAALSDADATARLFGFLSRDGSVRAEVHSRTPLLRPSYSPDPARAARTLKRRSEAQPPESPGGWVSRIAAAMPRDPVGPAEEYYLAVLDRALDDRHLSGEEKGELLSVAEALSLDRAVVVELHHRYLDTMNELALADGIVTPEERAELDLVASQLGLSDDPVPEVEPSTEVEPPPGISLRRGDRVTFTGETVTPRSEWERRAKDQGLDVGGVTKKSALVVAADPDSMSGKAKKARDYGVPIVGESAFALLIGSMP